MMTLIIYIENIIEIPKWIIKYLSININVMIKYINFASIFDQFFTKYKKMTTLRELSCTQSPIYLKKIYA